MDIAALHTAGKENSVGVLYHLCESIAGPLHHGVAGLRFVALPICRLGSVDEVGPEDDAHIIEFKSLGRVHAPYLVHTTREVTPQALGERS
jgi:hypothetical protein